MRDRLRVYTHAREPQRASELMARGYSAFKVGGIESCLPAIRTLRKELGTNIDLMVDAHGPPWMTVRDAIALGQALEEYDLLFYEEPVPPEDIESLARVADSVNLPLAAGGTIGTNSRRARADRARDRGRDPARYRPRRRAAANERKSRPWPRRITSNSRRTMARWGRWPRSPPRTCWRRSPISSSWERLADDVPQRYEVMTPQPQIESGYLVVPDAPGLGVDIVEESHRPLPLAPATSASRTTHMITSMSMRAPDARAGSSRARV